jgi:hypothetical protein
VDRGPGRVRNRPSPDTTRRRRTGGASARTARGRADPDPWGMGLPPRGPGHKGCRGTDHHRTSLLHAVDVALRRGTRTGVGPHRLEVAPLARLVRPDRHAPTLPLLRVPQRVLERCRPGRTGDRTGRRSVEQMKTTYRYRFRVDRSEVARRRGGGPRRARGGGPVTGGSPGNREGTSREPKTGSAPKGEAPGRLTWGFFGGRYWD